MSRIIRSSSLIDQPIFPGTRVELLPGSSLDLVFDDDTELELEAQDTWEYVRSHENAGWTRLSSELDNGFYHGSLEDVNLFNDFSRMTRQSLFAPQKAADVIGVDANIPPTIEVPALQESVIDFVDFATLRDVERVEIEVLGDDFFFSRINDTAFKFGPFDDLFSKSVQIRYIDASGNEKAYETSLIPKAPDIKIGEVEIVGDQIRIS